MSTLNHPINQPTIKKEIMERVQQQNVKNKPNLKNN